MGRLGKVFVKQKYLRIENNKNNHEKIQFNLKKSEAKQPAQSKIKEPQKFVTTSITRCKDTAFFDTCNKKRRFFLIFFNSLIIKRIN